MSQDFAPASLDTLTWLRPSPTLWSARRAVLALVAVPLIIAAGVLPTVAGSALAGGILALAVLIVSVVAFIVVRGRYRSWGYAERDEDLLVRRGILVRRLSVIPYGRMQFIDVTAGPVDRIFGLSTVQLHTAAASTDARIPGLVTVEAHRLRDKLAALGESRAAGL